MHMQREQVEMRTQQLDAGDGVAIAVGVAVAIAIRNFCVAQCTKVLYNDFALCYCKKKGI